MPQFFGVSFLILYFLCLYFALCPISVFLFVRVCFSQALLQHQRHSNVCLGPDGSTYDEGMLSYLGIASDNLVLEVS